MLHVETLRLRKYALGWIAVCAVFLCSLPVSAATWTVRSQPARLFNGAPVLFQVRPASKLESLSGTWLGHNLTFTYDSSTKTWFSLGGVSFETAPGSYKLELTGDRSAGPPFIFSRKFAVASAKYPKIQVELKVEKKFTEPSP